MTVAWSLGEEEPNVTEEVAWRCEVKLRAGEVWERPRTLYVIALRRGEVEERELSHVAVKKLFAPQLLQSLIQKQVRRCEADSAVRAAWHLLRQDPVMFSRRLLNIVMEDSLIHPKGLLITWVMIAVSKGWKIDIGTAAQLLQIVAEVAACPVHDVCIFDDIFLPGAIDTSPIEIAGTLEWMTSTCLAVLIRVCYGGMKGDMKFLRCSVGLWRRRMEEGERAWTELVRKTWDGVGERIGRRYTADLLCDDAHLQSLELREEDQIGYAVDFHCFGRRFIDDIQRYVRQHSPGVTVASEEDIKSAVWYWRSGVYKKEALSSSEAPIDTATVRIREGQRQDKEWTALYMCGEPSAELWTLSPLASGRRPGREGSAPGETLASTTR
eukprot:CAMPEP_0114610792 /NCGR_PEP_ID=MMETSP0168-20121206/3784_1 /TAXON_ID=95228 ORGANISM="Vannella sp., Strain DIVA3 517/6/12" /NCGR_SAMPLE_ID=MMETSP0168 /ASSEMBLY_ACC=CAM_ASM_000044 /LENGTH=381 /DNA_ID=CAMNT_0001821747 /DNA_START=84 /DNA_END=1226 /DNA_ORIENTATION=+